MSGTHLNSEKADIDERLSSLLTNASAIRVIASAVENTLGPKGLDTMLVDRSGDIVVTNAGVTILDRMEVTHPAARMLINIARNQHEQIGDGTTTATIMAGALVNEGLNYILKGIPVTMIIDGIKKGVNACLKAIENQAIPISDIEDKRLSEVTSIAGRNQEKIAENIVKLARHIGIKKLLNPVFKLSSRIISEVGAQNEVFPGLIIKKRRANENMPQKVKNTKVLIIEDSLRPEELSDSALKTESGFSKFLQYQEEFKKNIAGIINMGIKLIIIENGMDEFAEEILTREGVLVITRLHSDDFRNILTYTGAKAIKKSGIGRKEEEIEQCLGYAESVFEDEKLGHIRISGGTGEQTASFLVGATTEEVVGEKERIAGDAASSLQAALKGGIVPGGGSFEVSLIPSLKKVRNEAKGMSVYGVDCVIEALKRPMSQIIANAGFNPLEKLEDIMKYNERRKGAWGIDCDTGKMIDTLKEGIIDPALVKKHSLMAALEVTEAILRINTIIKMREKENGSSYYHTS